MPRFSRGFSHVFLREKYMHDLRDLAPINPNTGDRDYSHTPVRIRQCGRGSQIFHYTPMAPITSLYQRGVIWQ